ncbi:S8 family peptidase [Streptomyces sp. NRRL S-237]|uniref:S8 family peptidase n=1 Tax=Streptomyces sp. NRRL S-237 TaxID=1463895 RepID=UPI0004C5180C|nr:S8 family serine peptidase [Streptomyces sp. NRRL S-237]
MRPISRTALGAATAAVLAVTAVGPTAAQPADGATGAGKRPLVGSEAAGKQPTAPVTVTLVTGDRILVSTDAAGRTAATAMPRTDGSQPLVQTRQSGKDLYVYPEGAVKALAAGTVDPELFNVTGLVRQGYDDAHTKKLPLIAVYDGSVNVARSAPPTPRGADRSLVLGSIGAVALAADKEQAAAFWSDVTGTDARARSVSGGLKKLWLDGKVQANLERSTRQVAATAAWAAGYDGKGTKVAVLDTGTDLDHPDLRGRVSASKNFTDSDTDADRQGHGTHTISTVGGSGAESGGAKKGVAPGAELLSGKVLNDGGYGLDSWIIAGMEWAVEAKADVVSMSLGDPSQTACDDPLAAAAERLSQQGPLFVIAAGNSGPGNNTVSSPGCAPSVLTVGAVDRDDTTATFSSRGPAGLQHTLKPEIAAPGVGISAAAAAGRGVYAYQSMSGTSMATPHVAGAAAIVKQRHPDWSARQIKAALVGSAATTVPGDVRETGGGRLDVKAALDATVTGAPAVQGGTYNWPQDRSDRTTVEVPYTNTGKTPVTLNLAVEKVTGNDGSPVRAQVARLERRTVTVPAGATTRVPLALDPAAKLERSQYGDVTGRVVATAAGVRVSTPFSLYVEPETVTLRVKLVDRAGKPAAGPSSLDVIGTDDATGERRFNEGATDQVYRVRPGAYFLSAFVGTPDGGEGEGDRLLDSLTYLGRPQVELKKDTTVVLDARKAGRLDIAADKPIEARNITLGFARGWDDMWLHAGTAMGGRTLRGFYASVEGRAKDGDFEFASYWRAAAPLVSELKVVGGPVLHPITASTGSDNLDGTGGAPLVDAGSGTPEELAAAGAKDAVVLVKAVDGSLHEVAQNARDAGAKAVLAHRDTPGRWTGFTGYAGGALPALTIEAAEAKALLARLATGKVGLSWKAEANSPYVYSLALPEKGEVKGGHTYRVRDRDLGRTESTYNSMGVAADFIDMAGAYRPIGTAVYFGGIETVAAPGTRTEYHSAGDTAWDQLLSSSFPWGEFMTGEQRTYTKGQRTTAAWYDGVTGPVAPRDVAGRETLAAERQGNLIGFASAMWGDSSHAAQPGSFGDIGSLELKRGGEVVGESWYPFGVFEVPAEEGRYELTQSIEKIGSPARVWQRSTAVRTTWGFTSKLDASAYSQGLGILFPRYTAPMDGTKTVAAANGLSIGLGVTGHAGYTPGALKSAKLSYSYDGENWTQAKVSERGGRWSAVVDHAGASGKPVSLKVELTDAKGASVTQTVVRAYDVR